MKQLIAVLFLSLTWLSSEGLMAIDAIQWTTSYSNALERAQKESKPVVLFFTGSDWCGWCTRLEEEVFHKEEFAKALGDKMIFVMLDYPMKTQLDPTLKGQNTSLKQQYQITGYPTVIVLNAKGEIVGRTGYVAGGPKNYVDHLMSFIR